MTEPSCGCTSTASSWPPPTATGDIREYTTVLRMGTNGGLSEPWVGSLDDIRVYKRVLDVQEIQAVMAGVGPASELADVPSPKTDAADVPFDAALSWTPGEFAAGHDVYLGTTRAQVADADRANPMGVLVSQGQTAAEYEPSGLEYGQTYYWRVDEVNAAPDNTIFKGEVWSFTVEPYTYPIENVTATASSAQTGAGPGNTVNGSGLDDLGQHATESNTMWMTAGGVSQLGSASNSTRSTSSTRCGFGTPTNWSSRSLASAPRTL